MNTSQWVLTINSSVNPFVIVCLFNGASTCTQLAEKPWRAGRKRGHGACGHVSLSLCLTRLEVHGTAYTRKYAYTRL